MTALPPPADEQADNRTLDPLYRSDCHNAAVYVAGTDEGTNHYECVACKEACNYHPVGEQAAADELIKTPRDIIALYWQNIEFGAGKGITEAEAIAAIAAYSRTQTEAVLERLKVHKTQILSDDKNLMVAVPLSAINAELERLRSGA